jgi:hypothetical protein
VGHRVRVEAVHIPVWSTKALAWGYDGYTDEHVGFAVPPERGRALRYEIETQGETSIEIGDVELLFVRPAAESPARSSGYFIGSELAIPGLLAP